MKKWICTICGYVHEGEEAPERCPQCGAPKAKFMLQQAPQAAQTAGEKKWVCTICGYVHTGEEAPERCPQCGAPKAKFILQQQGGDRAYADEHRIGVAQGLDEQVVEGLRANFTGECVEVGMYLAMSRQADREGFPEVAEAYKRIAYEEADHAARFAELLGEVVFADTKKNLQLRAEAEYGATAGKMEIAKRAKELGYDAVHDTVHEMAKDEARHGKAFEGLLKRYF